MMYTKVRPETGPMRFANDLCGVFIRGDNCRDYAKTIELILEENKTYDFNMVILKDLLTLLRFLHDETSKQEMKEFNECVKE